MKKMKCWEYGPRGRSLKEYFVTQALMLGQVRLGQVRLGQVRLGQVRFLGFSFHILLLVLRPLCTQHNDIQHKDTQHNDTQCKKLKRDTQHNTNQNLVSLAEYRVTYCHAECHSDVRRYAKCRGAFFDKKFVSVRNYKATLIIALITIQCRQVDSH